MSDNSSDIDKGESYKTLSTDDFLTLVNADPLGFPCLSPSMLMERVTNRRTSLEGSDMIVSTDSTFSEELLEGTPANITRSTYGTLRRETEGVTISWRDLSVYVPQKKSSWKKHTNHKPFKRVLNNVSGAVKPGSLVALMGSSGAGKSTLMDALACRTPKEVVVDGDVLVNGRIVGPKVSSFSGCVHQQDLFIGSLTVKEHLTFMAKLRMDKNTSQYEMNHRVDEMMRELGLSKIQNTQIGIRGMEKCISGGERKRLSFASEILTDPPLLFCDEPTTGLDSYNAKNLVMMMKEMAVRGKTIICTIHQPSSEIFTLFDKLLLIVEGRIAFMGSSVGALEFFESLGYICPSTFNPADFYIYTLAVRPGHEISSRERITRICDNFAVSTHSKDINDTIQQQENLALADSDATIFDSPLLSTVGGLPNKPGMAVQFYWLTWRALVDSYRNPAIHRIRILRKIVIAVIIGLCYTDMKLNQAGIMDIQGVVLLFVTENSYSSSYGVLNNFLMEFPVFLREYKNGVYSYVSYYLARMISFIPGFIIDPMIFCVVCYWMVGLQNHFYHFMVTVITVIITANVSSACGSMCSAAFENLDYMMLFLVPYNCLLMVLSGFFLKVDTIPNWIEWLRYLSSFFYTDEILTITQWEGITNITCDEPPGTACISTGEEVIHKYAFEESNFHRDFILLILMYFVFHLIGFLGLRSRAIKA